MSSVAWAGRGCLHQGDDWQGEQEHDWQGEQEDDWQGEQEDGKPAWASALLVLAWLG